MRSNLYKSFYILVLFLAMVACKKGGEDPMPTPVATTVTVENYNSITVGMSYTQVVALLGQGTLASANNYSWSADDTNTIVIRVVFSNNLVQSKGQTGLISASGGGTSTGGTTGGTTAGGCPATYNGHTVYTGPRGGCYYINKNGNKTYI